MDTVGLSIKVVMIMLTFWLLTPVVFADRCPSTDEIIKREVSRDYDWTVDERTSLDKVLAVRKLIAARIMNNGEYISCRYSTGNFLLRLDGLPIKEECMLKVSSGKWLTTAAGETVCQEEDVLRCLYDIECQEDQY